MIDKVFADDIPRCHSCGCLVKPDIVFFGEALPDRFHELSMTVRNVAFRFGVQEWKVNME